MEAFDYLRAFNGLLGIACFLLLIVRLMGVWPKLASGQRILFSSILCWMLATVWGSFELIYQDASASYRTIVNMIGLLLMFTYLVEPRSLYRGRIGINPLGGFDFRGDKDNPDAAL